VIAWRALRHHADKILIAALFAAAGGGAGYVQHQAALITLEVSCRVAKSNTEQLEELRAISHELGIPIGFTVTPLPSECADFSAP
jgi:hypothetical protein